MTVLLCGVLAAAAVASGAGTAAAGEAAPRAPEDGGANATLAGLKAHDRAVITHDGVTTETAAGLFEMSVTGGGSLLTYGIDMYSSTAHGAQYAEAPWAATPLHGNPEAGRIRWIVAHSYPQVDDLAELAERSGARELTPGTAAAGTQVAIWRYAGAGADGRRPDVTAADPDAQKLADYLEREARTLPEPSASLTLESPAVAGRPGEALGPVTVRTGAQHVSVAPGPEAARHGVRVVDLRGAEVTEARDGDRLWFDVPRDAADAQAGLTVQATAQLPVGRALAGSGPHGASQAQVVAGSSDTTVTARASASWTAQGAAPAVSARPDCAAGTVAVTVANRGDAPFEFSLGDEEHAIPGETTETVTVPVGEDQAYRIAVTGPDGHGPTFAGVLNCATLGTESAEEGLSVHSEPVTVGGDSSGPEGSEGTVNLAETGGGSSLPLLTAAAVGLLVLGGGAVLMLRRTTP
ncbi:MULTISPECIES: thioester domain-containing protein [Streptomyces]|uniref:thioester domain-containing protein n=1 Tax=Streptomyces TaxID=1883 RepID=UPI0022489C42|nr:thioester domain-containing protein [Streptomyces sp. JHD 1]MCX2969957.1 thioester domain-containing protein [Streptomyces sp. JHD 1]